MREEERSEKKSLAPSKHVVYRKTNVLGIISTLIATRRLKIMVVNPCSWPQLLAWIESKRT